MIALTITDYYCLCCTQASNFNPRYKYFHGYLCHPCYRRIRRYFKLDLREGNCRVCKATKSISWAENRTLCKNCIENRSYKNRKESRRAYRQKVYPIRKETYRQRARERVERGWEGLKLSAARTFQKYKPIILAKSKIRKCKQIKATPKWLDAEQKM